MSKLDELNFFQKWIDKVFGTEKIEVPPKMVIANRLESQIYIISFGDTKVGKIEFHPTVGWRFASLIYFNSVPERCTRYFTLLELEQIISRVNELNTEWLNSNPFKE